ncbi:MAG: efflux RND transporter periplasmic adaptor subunit [Proteobacteria bacterium]|nr:efflux RND transporter periplasmic adaptor subunit [Pseudomonadota bacterium]
MKYKYFSPHGWTGWIAAMVIVCIMGGCKPEKTAQALTMLSKQTPVVAKPVTRVATNQVISVSGTLTADKTAPLSFLVPGKVRKVYVDEGDHVRSGTVLAMVEANDYQNNLDIAEAALHRTHDAYDRYEPLYRQGAFAEKNFIELKTGLAQAVATCNIARKALADTKLVAPIPGIVGVKGIEIGQMVSPQVLAFTIVKTDMIYARVSVPESEIGQVSMGQTADVMIPALDGHRFTGKVSMIGAVADAPTRTYAVKIELANPKFLLRPGMIVQAGILTNTAMNMLTVPGNAIVRDANNLTYVFVADAPTGLAQLRRVVPGATYQSEIQIKSGLKPHDCVIVSGQHKLTDGTPISMGTITKEDRP